MIRECEACGKIFSGTQYQGKCPKCRRQVTARNRPTGGENAEREEAAIQARAIERAKKNDRIVAEGYAERQIQKTLEGVPKIDVTCEV